LTIDVPLVHGFGWSGVATFFASTSVSVTDLISGTAIVCTASALAIV
jgi:hypothetical protein